VSGVISDCGATGFECNASGAAGGSLVKVGVGALTLSGVNTYSGGTAINGGTLAVSNDNNLGAASGGLSLGGGTLQWLAGFNSARTVTLTGSGTFDTNGFTATLAGPIVGNGSLTKAGTYTGATNVNGGTLLGLNPNSFSAASAFTIAAGATLDLAGADEKIGSLAGAGAVMTTNGIAKLTTGGSNASTTFSGVLQDRGGANVFALDKTGISTFTLSGINTYRGATTVNGGTLSVTGDISSSSGVTANAGGTLNGPGCRRHQIHSAQRGRWLRWQHLREYHRHQRARDGDRELRCQRRVYHPLTGFHHPAGQRVGQREGGRERAQRIHRRPAVAAGVPEPVQPDAGAARGGVGPAVG